MELLSCLSADCLESRFQLKGTISPDTFVLAAALNLTFPLVGPVISPDIAGSLADTSLGLTYRASDGIYGLATFSIIDGWLHAEFAATTFGVTFDPISIDLVEVTCVLLIYLPV